jgi:nitroreductase
MDLATVEELLSTTRSVRRRLDLERPVEPEIIEWAISLALQAPSGSNRQHWRFLVVTDPSKRAAIGRIYRQVFDEYGRALREQPNPYPAADPRHVEHPRVMSSAAHLAENFAAVPVHVIAAIEGRVEKLPAVSLATLYGSILPAAWSFMLALRARGIGSAWTTIHVARERQIAALLGIPETFTQAVLLPVAYFRGATFRRAPRLPARSVTYWNEWGRGR